MSARWVVVGCLLALGAARAEAQEDFQVHTGVDARRIGQQDTVEFKIEVKGTGFTSVDPPDLTGLRDFEVLDGPRRVQRQSIVNGQFSAAVELLWTLGPRRTGRMTVPALMVKAATVEPSANDPPGTA